MTELMTSFVQLSPIDIAIAILSFVVGNVTFRNNKGLGLFMKVSWLLLVIARHYIKTHPDSIKIPEKYKLAVDRLSVEARQQIPPAG